MSCSTDSRIDSFASERKPDTRTARSATTREPGPSGSTRHFSRLPRSEPLTTSSSHAPPPPAPPLPPPLTLPLHEVREHVRGGTADPDVERHRVENNHARSGEAIFPIRFQSAGLNSTRGSQ